MSWTIISFSLTTPDTAGFLLKVEKGSLVHSVARINMYTGPRDNVDQVSFFRMGKKIRFVLLFPYNFSNTQESVIMY